MRATWEFFRYIPNGLYENYLVQSTNPHAISACLKLTEACLKEEL